MVYYDDSFQERFGANAITRIMAIMALVDEQFSENSFQTKLEVVTKDIQQAIGYNWGTFNWANCPGRYATRFIESVI